MCTQSVGLLAGVLEGHGIATVCVALLREVAIRMGIPRALAVPFRFGLPLGGGGPVQQHQVIGAALELLRQPAAEPRLVDWKEDGWVDPPGTGQA